MEKQINTPRTIRKYQIEEDLMISYKELDNLPLNESMQLVPSNPGAVEFVKISSYDTSSLMFVVTMKKNQLWERHHHDCEESCVVFKGRLKDLLTGKAAGPAESLDFKQHESHYVVAEVDSIFYVKFNKPKNIPK